MKICHVTSAHKNNDIRILEKQCVSLAKKSENEVYLVASGESKKYKNVTIVGIGARPGSRLKRMIIHSRKAFKTSLKIDADIYHLHDPELLQYVRKYIKKNKKVIFDSHEDVLGSLSEKNYIPKIIRKQFIQLFTKYFKSVVSSCSAVVAVTPHCRDDLVKFNPMCYLITNYPIIREEQKIQVEKNKNVNSVHKIIFAGGISEDWRHRNILRAIEPIENVEYHIYGTAAVSYLEELKQEKGWDKVVFWGQTEHEKVKRALVEADIGVAISRYGSNAGGRLGTLGNTKLFEEMQAGLPVIATDFVLWKEIIEGHKCGICVSPDSVEEIRDAICTLINDEDLAVKMGENGKEAVIERFNWKSQETILLELYEHIS
ncbi:GDP-mannose-dependent alpha-(1-6)-phosphatidylinositol monomannoside mannosyltransferase [uncultured Eubacterium sp.]|nr:GDP-mannose-dependent alpha-(1-6)-phosphatidylinositol monomannoside mannosyltransferase [uncultured Eubacterium sp.]